MQIVHSDTITAISTPPGFGAIGIVRVSGPEAREICRKLFKPRKKKEIAESHRLQYGDLVSFQTGNVIDEVLVTLMQRPHSYTGEDILEIHCHGGPAILQAVLEETLAAGARIARPGEFTERAYLNGRIDLAQAEAVMDMILAKTDQARDQALSHLRGNLSGAVRTLRSDVLDLLAIFEASIDFPEEVAESEPQEMAGRIAAVSHRIEAILSTYEEGRLFIEGMTLVIAGKANVGKSSLLNRLLGEERAIVTPIPGTTRDFIAEMINIGGIPVKLVDTAGIRDSSDEIECKGIEKVWEKVGTADAVILVLDGSATLDRNDEVVAHRVLGAADGSGKKPVIVAVNKEDLSQKVTEAEIQGLIPGIDVLRISAKYGEGISELKNAVYRLMMGQPSDHCAEAAISNVRHRDALKKALDFLNAAVENLLACCTVDLVACDLREALGALGDVIGENTSEDVLERIFSSFCIGK